jgi:hypothetical protein
MSRGSSNVLPKKLLCLPHRKHRSEGWLVFSHDATISRGNLIVVGAFSFRVVVVAGANEAPVLRRLGEGWPKLLSSLDAMRNSLVESSMVAYSGVDAPR